VDANVVLARNPAAISSSYSRMQTMISAPTPKTLSVKIMGTPDDCEKAAPPLSVQSET